MFSVYILINKNGDRTYTGYTSDLRSRLLAHNNGEVRSSKSHRPYFLLHVEEVATKKEAKEKELYFKSTTGRKRLREFVALWKNKK